MNSRKYQIGGNHYQSAIQPIDFILANNLGFCEGSIIKYVSRHKAKNGRQDIEKAMHYCQFLLDEYDKEDKDERTINGPQTDQETEA